MKFSSDLIGAVTDDATPLVDAPLASGSKTWTLDLTTSDAEIELSAGFYLAFADAATDTVVVGLGVDTTGQPPASGSAGADAILVAPPATTFTFRVDALGPVHARVLTGTATLRITRLQP